MATFTKFNSLVEALAEKVHNLGADVLTVALTNAANAPVAGNAVLADLVQIAYTNLSTRVITVLSSAQSAGVYQLTLQDLILTAGVGGLPAFRYAVIYNDTATNKELIGYIDNGSEVTLAENDTFKLDFDAVNGILKIQ